MSNLPDRLRSPVRSMIGGNPALTRAHVAAAVFELERVARPLIPKGVRHTLHVLLGFLNKTSLQCSPCQQTLAEAVGAHRATIVRHLQVLEAVGLITRCSLPVGQGRRGRESDYYSFAFGLVGRPELVWKPSVEAVKPRGRRPVRAADGTFRSAAAARNSVAAGSDLNPREAASVVQAESEAASLDDPPKAEGVAAVPVYAMAPLSVSPALRGLIGSDRPRALAPLPVGRASVSDLLARLGGKSGGSEANG